MVIFMSNFLEGKGEFVPYFSGASLLVYFSYEKVMFLRWNKLQEYKIYKLNHQILFELYFSSNISLSIKFGQVAMFEASSNKNSRSGPNVTHSKKLDQLGNSNS